MMPETRKRRFGDRYDGWRLRHTQSFFSVMPHIMKRRSDSSVLFDDVVEIEELEKYVRRLRRDENMPGFSMFHLFIAASVRMITLRPWLNRFVVGGKTYARNRLTISMTVKRSLSKDAEEVVIKPISKGRIRFSTSTAKSTGPFSMKSGIPMWKTTPTWSRGSSTPARPG